ncbi:CatB-related O-acetyltransferase [Phocaeicola sp.]
MNILKKIRWICKFYYVRYKWRTENRHNYTRCANLTTDSLFPLSKVHVGKYTYGPLRVIAYSIYDANLYIGNFCSIASEVCFLLGGEHDYHYLSTYPFKAMLLGQDEAVSKGDIIVEDDVWIGHSSIILSGVTLSRGTIVAAGSVIVKSTEPYSIVGGNPAKFIKKRFTQSTIDKLMKLSFEKWDTKYILEKWDEIYERLE